MIIQNEKAVIVPEVKETKSNTVPKDKQLSQLQLDIMNGIIEGTCILPEDIAEEYGLSILQVSKLLQDPMFTTTLGEYSKSRLLLHTHTEGMDRLIQITRSQDEKTALSALKLTMELSGTKAEKQKSNTLVNVDLGSILDKLDGK